jgi:hypothetical protein
MSFNDSEIAEIGIDSEISPLLLSEPIILKMVKKPGGRASNFVQKTVFVLDFEFSIRMMSF